MPSIQRSETVGAVNETTVTVHKHEIGAADLRPPCGHTKHVEHDGFRIVGGERAIEEHGASTGGGCIEAGGGTQRTAASTRG